MDRSDDTTGNPSDKGVSISVGGLGVCLLLGVLLIVTYLFLWLIGVDMRSNRTLASENFLAATQDSAALLDEGKITIGRGKKKTLVAKTAGRKYPDSRHVNISCVFSRDGDVKAYAETFVQGRYGSWLSNYNVTGKIDEHISRCVYFETASKTAMENAVKDGFWKAIPKFKYH